MSENLRNCLKDLEFVSKIKCNKTQKKLLTYMSKNPKYYLALREITLNVIKGNAQIDDKTEKRLSKHKKDILELVKSKNSLAKRKKLVVQSGGWLWLIPLISSVIDLVLR
jgi:hypothetical protein